MRLADALRLDIDLRRQVYHQAILRYIGCNADTHLLATGSGDEMALCQDLAITDFGNHAALGQVFAKAFNRRFADLPPDRLQAAEVEWLAHVFGTSIPILAGHCDVAGRIGQRLGLTKDMQGNHGQPFERWEGKGRPKRLSGHNVRLPVRIVTLAQDAIALTKGLTSTG